MSGAEDGLARLLLECASQVEAERQRKVKLKRMEEQRRRWLHEKAIEEARGKLRNYAELIKEAENLLEKREVDVERAILRELYGQLESNPQYVAREAQSCSELLRRNLDQAKERIWLGGKLSEAVTLLCIYKERMREVMDNLTWQFYRLRMDCLTNSELKKIILEGLKVKSLDEAEQMIKSIFIDGLKEEFNEKLKGNPYRWVTLYLQP